MNETNNIEKSLMKLRFVQSFLENNNVDNDVEEEKEEVEDNEEQNDDNNHNHINKRNELINELKSSSSSSKTPSSIIIKKSTKIMHGTYIPEHYDEKDSNKKAYKLPFSKPSGSLHGLGLDKKAQMSRTYNVDWCIDDTLLQELSYEAKCNREKDENSEILDEIDIYDNDNAIQ
jgi:hypothetical protein